MSQSAPAPPTGPVKESVLSLTGVNKRFGAVQALTEVSLQVAPGEVVALVGDNGAGKSTRFSFVTGWASYAIVVLIVGVYLISQWRTTRQRRAAELAPPWWPLVLGKAALLTAGLGFLTYYVNIDRGFSYLWWLFFGLVVVVDFALRRTVWGRHVFAVGGHVEAARRSGIKVDRVFMSVFVLTSLLAAVGGLVGAGLQTSVSQATGTTDTNLTAIAAAVIGGTSLFGGRGSAWAALLGSWCCRRSRAASTSRAWSRRSGSWSPARCC